MSSSLIRATALVAFALLSVSANGQARLNDTGVMQAYGSGGLWPCTATNTGDAAAHPRQDCRFGRDAMADAGTLSKIGGAAGFDYTPLDSAGNAISVVNGLPVAQPICVRDNVTNLIWEVKTQDNTIRDYRATFTWYDSNVATNGGNAGLPQGGACAGSVNCDTQRYAAAVNGSALCGFASGWRLPTRREMMSSVHNGKLNSGQWIDANFFAEPSNGQTVYWTSESYRTNTGFVWYVDLRSGDSAVTGKVNPYSVRLVRTAP